MMYPWINERLREKELEESVQDLMREEGLDPNNIRESATFTDRANRHAVLAGHPERQISVVDNDTDEVRPDPAWVERMIGMKPVDMSGTHSSPDTERGYLPSGLIKAG